MSAVNGSLQRVFWGWHRPVLEFAVAWLTAAWDSERGLDLADTLVLVPTAEAGRRLRRALAEWADPRGSAVSVPHVWPPHLALDSQGEGEPVAGDLEVRAAWILALRTVPLNQLKALLPVQSGEPGWRWQWEVAEMLTDLQELLGAGGYAMADLAERAADLPAGEAARWRDLARLEAAMESALHAQGKQNPQSAKRARAGAPVLPEGVHRVVVLPSPDLPPLLRRWLQACAALGCEVQVMVQAPETLAAGFDATGAPLPTVWGEDAGVETGLRPESIQLAFDPVAQAEKTMEWVAAAATAGLPVAVGVCDAEVSPLLREKLEAGGLHVFEPGGQSLRQEGLWHLARLVGELLFEDRWQALTSLARIPEVRRAWTGNLSAKVLEALDAFQSAHLPGGVALAEEILASPDPLPASVTERGDVRAVLEGVRRWRQLFQSERSLTEVVRKILISLYGERGFHPEAPGDRERLQAGWAWLEEAEALERTLLAAGLEVEPSEWWSLVLARLAARRLEATRGEVDLVLQGWLELLWEDAPALVVAGLNEEHVPGILLGHPFLPDHLRQALGLPCQASRFARDAYLLTALTQQRADQGRLGVVCGQWSARGDARRPSRLLMLCPLTELPDRVRQLFPKELPGADRPEGRRSLAWQLRPERRPVRLESISVSKLRDYLQCPFRFYLKRGLGMEAVSLPGREMDALQFGQLVHRALRAYAEDATARQWVHAERIAAFLCEQVQAAATDLFGPRLAPLVRLQVGAAEQRLRAWADVEARERQLGWEIVAAEWEISEKVAQEDGSTKVTSCLMIEGVPLVGQVDRVERHAPTGKQRLLDFKTAEKALDPFKEHLKKAGPSLADLEDWRRLQGVGLAPGDRPWIWVNLQLPLYAAALRRHALGAVDEVAYVCLPKAVTQTALRSWEGFDETWEAAALDCAAEAVRRIREGQFWPPNETARLGPEWDGLFPEGPTASVRWE